MKHPGSRLRSRLPGGCKNANEGGPQGADTEGKEGANRGHALWHPFAHPCNAPQSPTTHCRVFALSYLLPCRSLLVLPWVSVLALCSDSGAGANSGEGEDTLDANRQADVHSATPKAPNPPVPIVSNRPTLLPEPPKCKSFASPQTLGIPPWIPPVDPSR